MNLRLINNAFSDFFSEVSKTRFCEIDWLYYKQLRLSEKSFTNFDDLGEWFDVLFQTEQTKKFWKGDQYRPAELIRDIQKFDPDMTVIAFKDLFDENRDLEGRIDRFKFYMDELIVRRRRSLKKEGDTWHHQDNSIISFYLSMEYPEKYCYYRPEIHRNAITAFEAKPIGNEEVPARYMKFVSILYNIFQKEGTRISTHLNRFDNPIIPESRLIIYEFLDWLCKL